MSIRPLRSVAERCAHLPGEARVSLCYWKKRASPFTPPVRCSTGFDGLSRDDVEARGLGQTFTNTPSESRAMVPVSRSEASICHHFLKVGAKSLRLGSARSYINTWLTW